MKPKLPPEKTPLWVSIIRLNIFLVFLSMTFIPMEPTLFGFAVYKIVFFGSILSIFLGAGLGVTAYAARRTSINKTKNEAESTPSQSL
jgi:hypothetical protein